MSKKNSSVILKNNFKDFVNISKQIMILTCVNTETNEDYRTIILKLDALYKIIEDKAADRKENIRRIGEVSKLFTDAGIITLASFISPYQEDRDIVREIHEQSGLVFIEIFVDCKLESAEKRDPKGLYKKARKGEIKNFTGIDDPYETPSHPEIHLISDRMSVEDEVEEIIKYLSEIEILV